MPHSITELLQLLIYSNELHYKSYVVTTENT